MFNQRSYQKELLDESDIPKSLLYQNLKELEFINKYLGGHAISVNGLKKITIDKSKIYTIMDIGCGGGDSLKAIANWSKKEGYSINLNGVDLKEDCISYAKNNCSNYDTINFRCEDFRNAFSEQVPINIVHASLFCHHFTESEIIDFIKLCSKNKAIFVINDLERNSIAYYSIKLLTKLFSKSPLVKNDAPLSVLRGFKKTEWISILQKSGIENYTVKNRWAFRHLVIVYPNES
jgi:2-polyprenyl-3-methyl-5-hydroxy-6-metoxy-1,4-benzoquinol methylase